MKISDLLDKPVLTVPQLAARHNMTVDQVQAALAKGIRVELEHSSDPKVARQIALAHVAERPDYYDELAKIDETTRTTKAGAPGTLKAKISRLYGGTVTCAKAQKLKTRSGATAHDKAQANWFQNMNCGGATRVDEIFQEPAQQLTWRSYGGGQAQFWETEFSFYDWPVSIEMHPDVKQTGARFVFRNRDIPLPPEYQGWHVIFRVNNSTDITGKLGNKSVRVLTQVVSVIKGFLQTHDWDYVLFTGEEGSRDKLYQALSQRLADRINAQHIQYRSDFVIYKPIMQEQAGVGLVVPGVNMPAGQHADEIRRQARKFGFDVTAQGVPPKVRTDGKY